MTQAQIDVEKDGGRDKERWRLYGRWVNMESEREERRGGKVGVKGGDVK